MLSRLSQHNGTIHYSIIFAYLANGILLVIKSCFHNLEDYMDKKTFCAQLISGSGK